MRSQRVDHDHAADALRLSQTARPIITASDAKAENQVMAASAAQPPTPSNRDNSAALKCHK